jgi:hypothetical protein
VLPRRALDPNPTRVARTTPRNRHRGTYVLIALNALRRHGVTGEEAP